MIRMLCPTLLILCAALFAGPAAADESAEDIVRTSREKTYHGNSIQQMELTQIVQNGTKQKTLSTSTRIDSDAVKTHAMIVVPVPLKGTQFLTIVGDGVRTRRWMYMPAGDTLNEMEDGGLTRPFLGTDFTYEDMELGDPDAGTHTLLGSETITVGGQSVECHKIESTPKPELTSMYGRLVTWIEKGSYAPRRVLLFAKEDPATEFKRLTFEGVAVENGAVVPTNMLMENLAKGTSTRIEVTEYRLDVPAEELPDALFDPDQLRNNVPE